MGFKQREESLKERIENFSSYSTAERTFAKIGYDVGFIDGKQQSGWQLSSEIRNAVSICRSHLPENPKDDFATDKLMRNLCELLVPSPPTDNSHRQGTK